MATVFVTKKIEGASPEAILEIMRRMRRGEDCLELVETGKVTRRELDRVRKAITENLKDHFALDDPTAWQVMELARLEDIEHQAAKYAEQLTAMGRSPMEALKLRVKVSESRRALIGTDAPKKTHHIVTEKPQQELLMDILAKARDVTPA